MLMLVHLSNSLPQLERKQKSGPNSSDVRVVAQERLVGSSVWDTDALSPDGPGHAGCWCLMALDWRCQVRGDGKAVLESLYGHTGQLQAEAVVHGGLECVRAA